MEVDVLRGPERVHVGLVQGVPVAGVCGVHVARVAGSAGWGLVVVFAVAFQSGLEAVLEAGGGVAVPVLEPVRVEDDAGAATLVGEDGDLVDQVGWWGQQAGIRPVGSHV